MQISLIAQICSIVFLKTSDHFKKHTVKVTFLANLIIELKVHFLGQFFVRIKKNIIIFPNTHVCWNNHIRVNILKNAYYKLQNKAGVKLKSNFSTTSSQNTPTKVLIEHPAFYARYILD